MESGSLPKAREKRGLTWIQLSDWHHRPNEFDRQVIRDALIKDIERRASISPDLAKIDFIVFGGDLAYSGRSEEYSDAREQFLDPLLRACDLSPSKLFIVPGNSDMDRTVLESLPVNFIQPNRNIEEIENWLIDNKKRKVLLEPFQAFTKFVTNYTGQEHPDYANIRRWEINGKNVAILGLNSSFMSGRNKDENGWVNDEGSLFIGEPQIYSSIDAVSNADLRIAIIHHPFEWLDKMDREKIENQLMRSFDFILLGHDHKASVRIMENASSFSSAIVYAGPAYQGQRSLNDPGKYNSYNFIHLDFDTEKFTIFIRQWNENLSAWIEDAVTRGKHEFHITTKKRATIGQINNSPQQQSNNENLNEQHGDLHLDGEDEDYESEMPNSNADDSLHYPLSSKSGQIRQKTPINANDELAHSLVRVFNDKKQIVGAGFFVDNNLILTSSKVIALALGRIEDFPLTAKAHKEDIFYIDFPFIQSRKFYSAKNTHLVPRNPDGGGDFATLTLDREIPIKVKPLKLLRDKNIANNIKGHTFWAFALSTENEIGNWFNGIILEKLENEWQRVKIKYININGPIVHGTPIWDEQLSRFIGMAVIDPSQLQTENWIGHIIPSEYLINQLSMINDKTVNINLEYENSIKNNKIIGTKSGDLHGIRSDKVAKEDQLGFKHYIDAFVELIESPETQLPLTIGIYGSWGMGKSFILDHIEKKISKNKKNILDYKINIHTIKFNAWEYNASKAIWPGLVRKIMDQMEHELVEGKYDLLKIKLQRMLRRPLKKAISQIVILIVSVLLLASYILLKFNFDSQSIITALFGLTLVSLVTIINILINLWFSPLSQRISSLFEDKSYGQQIAYMEEIRSDLKFLQMRLDSKNKCNKNYNRYMVEINADVLGHLAEDYLNNVPEDDDTLYVDRILVLIDDLDRCEPNKAVEVLQAINLLLNFEELNFIILLGIDARISTRAIEGYYKDLLGKSGTLGFEYLEKIIQIPFRIPEPSKDDLEKFIRQQLNEINIQNDSNLFESNNKENVKKVTVSDSHSEEDEKGKKGPDEKFSLKESTKDLVKLDEVKLDEDKKRSSIAFERSEIDAFCKFSPFMRPNPRHIKRLMNIYQLVRILAKNKRDTFMQENPDAVIKWLLICGQWPQRTQKMLDQYDRMAIDGSTDQGETEKKDILEYLYEISGNGANGTMKNDDRQKTIDYKPEILRQIIYNKNYEINTYKKLSSTELDIIRRYTINFNPAIEAELESNIINR